VAGHVAQVILRIDAEIGEIDHLWMETSENLADHVHVIGYQYLSGTPDLRCRLVGRYNLFQQPVPPLEPI